MPKDSANKYKEITFKKDTSDLRKKRFESLALDILPSYIFNNPVLHSLSISVTNIDVSRDLKNCKIFYKISQFNQVNDDKMTNENDKKIDKKQIYKILKANCVSVAGFLFKQMNLRSKIFINFIYDKSSEWIEQERK